MAWRDRIAALLGVSAYQPTAPVTGLDLDDPQVVEARERVGGNLAPMPITRLRWYLKDLEAAQHAADGGDLAPAAQLYRAMRRDGTFTGLLSTRTAGLVRLPRKFSGKSQITEALKARNGTRSVFDEMCPPSELALIGQDGVMLGVGIGELVPVPGRVHPILIRLEPEFLQFRWNEGRWYYRSAAGQLPITPGDGRWVMHVPAGRMSPWQFGQWIACGEAWINKSHGKLHRSNYGGKLANPARVIHAPPGSTEEQRLGALRRLAQWGINNVFALPMGWQASLLESKGEGYQVWANEEESANRDFMMSLAGQVVTSEGGKGFSNADVHKAIRADLIQSDGDELAHTVNTQVLPRYVLDGWGEDALIEGASAEWDTTPPKDRQAEANAMSVLATAIKTLNEALKPYGKQLEINEIVTRFGVPVEDAEAALTEIEAEAAANSNDQKPALRAVESEAA